MSLSQLRIDRAPSPRNRCYGFTLIELLVAVVVIGLLATISANVYANALEKSRTTRAIADLYSIEKAIADFQIGTDGLPDSLDDIGWRPTDPWGNPYRYLKLPRNAAGKIIPGNARKDRFLVPLNSDYDLYSRQLARF